MHSPETNIDLDEFIGLKINWLIKNNDLDLIKEFILKNHQGEFNNKLLEHYLDRNLSLGKIDKSCEIFSQIKIVPEDKYISKYKIYCLLYQNKKEVAQLQYDLLKEAGFNDVFFNKSFNYLSGYQSNPEIDLSEENLLDFHLSYLCLKDFSYEPNENTKKLYGSTYLLIIF